MEPYSMFITNEEKGPLEEETVQTIKEILGTDAFDDGIL
jgi:hypothetical protein